MQAIHLHEEADGVMAEGGSMDAVCSAVGTGRVVPDNPAGNDTVSQPESSCVWEHSLVVVAFVFDSPQPRSYRFCSLQQGVEQCPGPGQCPVARPRHSALGLLCASQGWTCT
jgi:hypothetical protein